MRKIQEIETLTSKLFNLRWQDLFGFDGLSELKGAGVYLLAFSGKSISGKKVEANDVFYVGMSNAKAGVGSRLKRFREGTLKCRYHSAAKRFYREYCGNRPFSEAFVRKSIFFVAQEVGDHSDRDSAEAQHFRLMGHVACLEQYAIAHVMDRTGRMPALNRRGAPRD